jgi:hypothetical protein
VIKGMDVVDRISKIQTNADDFPEEEVDIISIKMLN